MSCTEIEIEFFCSAPSLICRGQSRISSYHLFGIEKFELMCDHEKSNIKIRDDICESKPGKMVHI